MKFLTFLETSYKMIKYFFRKRPPKNIRKMAYKFLEMKLGKLIVYDSFKDGTEDGLLITYPNGKVVMLAGVKKEMYYDRNFFESMILDLEIFFNITDKMFFHLWIINKYKQVACKRFEFYHALRFPFYLDEGELK